MSLLIALAGCNKTEPTGNIGITSGQNTVVPTGPNSATLMVQGACPEIVLLDGTASYRTYAKGAKDDPSQITYQASLANTTRQCVINESQLKITVMAQGRVMAGPAGGPGTVTLPIRVAATDKGTAKDLTLYSELTQFPVEVPAGTTTNQFVFTKEVILPGGAGGDAKIYLGFDEGPPAKRKN